MSAYPYPQTGYGYPPLVPAPNPFYGPPRAQYNGYGGSYSTVQYPQYRRPSDSGAQTREKQASQKHKKVLGKASDEDEQAPRSLQPTRPRNNSWRGGLSPDHIFVTLSSHDTLKMSNITSAGLVENLREELLPHWHQGVANEKEFSNNEWTVKFLGGDVWSATGRHAIVARRLVCRLFFLLAVEGFGYLATIDLGHPLKSPRMVFTSVPPDPDARYFMISFSLNRRTLTIIDAPKKLALLLGAALRLTETVPSSTTAETARWISQGVYEVQTSARGSGRQDIATLMGGALKMIAAEGYRFEASVPFGKAGIFGLRGRRETWMFRQTSVLKSSRRRRN